MLLRLDTTDRRPLHEQVAAALRRAIADGSCPPRLPPARELAAGLGVNPNTVLRALRDLRDEACWSSGADGASASPTTPRHAAR